MWKQIALRAALPLICALQLGVSGCGSKPPTPAAGTEGNPHAVPTSAINQMKSMPPEQRQRMLDSMKGSPQYDQVKQAVEGGAPSSPSGGQ